MTRFITPLVRHTLPWPVRRQLRAWQYRLLGQPPAPLATQPSPPPIVPIPGAEPPPPTTPQFDPRDPFQVQQRLLAGRTVQTIFDLGGHHGQTARAYAERFPSATVHSFEPFPESFAELCRQSADCPRIKPKPLAVADQEGVAELHCNHNSATNSLLPTAPAAGRWCDGPAAEIAERGTLPAAVTTLDTYCGRESIGHIDILKMDLQGGELRCLHGAADLLSRRAVSLIFCEVVFVPLYAGQSRFDEICRLLFDAGFGLYGFFQERCDEHGRLKWCDALFLADHLAME